MKKRTERVLLCLFVLLCGTKASAQWTVFDPSNLVQSIINSTNEMVETSSTAATMLKNFEETARIYQQSKQYYDKLKSVSNLVKNARKAQQCVLLVGEISDIYMDGYRRMLSDDNFSQKELSAIAYGYTRLLQESTHALQDLKEIVNPTEMSMTDKDRLDVIERVHAGLLGGVGLSIFSAGLFLLAVFADQVPNAGIALFMAMCGFGFGLFQTPNNSILISSAPQNRSGGLAVCWVWPV